MKLKVATQPNLSETSTAHQQALAEGNEHFRKWQRNVIDRYKDLSEEDIRADLQATAHPFAVCFENWIGDFNISTGIRNANAFNVREVFYIGNRKWDKRGAVGVHNYTPVQWIENMEQLFELQNSYIFVGVDNVPGSVPIETYQWPVNPILILGEEGTGLTPAMQALCRDIVHIEMFGSVRSFNAGTASGIAMYDFVKKFRCS